MKSKEKQVCNICQGIKERTAIEEIRWRQDYLIRMSRLNMQDENWQRIESLLQEIDTGNRDLAMLVKRLARHIMKVNPNDKLACAAMEYLQRKGLPRELRSTGQNHYTKTLCLCLTGD